MDTIEPTTDALSAADRGDFDEARDLDLIARFPLDALLDDLRTRPGRAEVKGLDGGALAFLIARLRVATGRRIVVLTADDHDAQQLAQDLELFHGRPESHDVLHVPPAHTSPYGDISPDRAAAQDRLAAIFRLHMGIGAEIVVLSVASLMRRIMPVQTLIEYADVIRVGTTDLTNERLRKLLADGGYSAVSLVEDTGSFAIRGDIVDVWTPYDDHPVRIERWGDEVTSIKSFDPDSQRTREDREDTFIFPVREDVLTEDTIASARTRLHTLADECHLPSKQVRQVIGDIQAGIHFLGIENLLPAFYPRLGSIIELIDDEALICVDRPAAVQAAITDLFEKLQGECERRRAPATELVFGVHEHFIDPELLFDWIDDRPRIVDIIGLEVLDADAPPSAAAPDRRYDFRVQPNHDIVRIRKERQGAEGTVHAIMGLLDGWKKTYGRIVFACSTAGETQRLAELFESYKVKVERHIRPIDTTAWRSPPAASVQLVTSPLSAGFRSPALSLAVISGGEIFGRQRRAASRERTFLETSAIASFRDLEVGDTVVHVDFGIGRYGGLHRMTLAGVPGDFLLIEYSGADKLYLPVYRLGRVQRYIGAEAIKRLDKLGSGGWEKTKARIKAQLKELAMDLIELYARRQIMHGHRFPGPDAYFHEFEAAFPYEETPDQVSAIDAVLGDMQKPQIMDRLICGDVGFGKTEVAIRAAFLAVLAGKQVAVLVPTTVLCEQHLSTFRERVANYPVRVESLSRFRAGNESKAILADAAAGKVDILIGTHRLLSKDIKFRDLGLLIVDEEQRFGVGHKEKLKELKANVDALTLSATPIPRTLHMSLMGLRDMTIIATPPPGRLSVRTHIARSSDNVIREAILREIQRGGQVYFVHNRVETIEETGARLREIVPEARIIIGHGQMKEHQLEKVMVAFVKGDYNVLLCTTIIESGLDISNANTMLIDHADRFGLSQLYQLRGRIGRSRSRAWCYLLVHGKRLSDEAQQRLEVIERFTELGSGFHVASYDLEMRGAGNLLGAEQSGTVNAVGLDLYGELLEECIAEVRGEEVETEIEPEVNIPVPAFIPEGYIQDVSLRLVFYKRLSLARSDDELSELYTELVDRFGDPPTEVDALREVVAIKIGMRRLRADRLDAGAGAVEIQLNEKPRMTPKQAMALIHTFLGRYRVTPDRKFIRTLTPEEADAGVLKAARMVCREMLQAAGLA